MVEEGSAPCRRADALSFSWVEMNFGIVRRLIPIPPFWLFSQLRLGPLDRNFPPASTRCLRGSHALANTTAPRPIGTPGRSTLTRILCGSAGVLTRHDHRRAPPMVDYAMTAFGSTLARALMPLCERGTEHRARIAGIISWSRVRPSGASPTWSTWNMERPREVERAAMPAGCTPDRVLTVGANNTARVQKRQARTPWRTPPRPRRRALR